MYIFDVNLFASYVGILTCLFLVFSYCGAQIFEIYGLEQEVVDLAFRGSVSKIGGLTLDEVRIQLKALFFPLSLD